MDSEALDFIALVIGCSIGAIIIFKMKEMPLVGNIETWADIKELGLWQWFYFLVQNWGIGLFCYMIVGSTFKVIYMVYKIINQVITNLS